MTTAKHPFGNQATASRRGVLRTDYALRPFGFASQPYDWFAVSRMMTPQALFAGTAPHRWLWVLTKNGLEKRSRRVTRVPERTLAKGPTLSRHASEPNL